MSETKYSFINGGEVSESIEHTLTDRIICPHCGFAESDSWERLNDNTTSGEAVCERCEKSFSWEAEFDVTYSTDKIKQLGDKSK